MDMLLKIFAFLVLSTSLVQAQSNVSRPIRENDVLFRKHIIRSVNLKRFSNEEIFGRNNTLAKVLLDAVREGKLTAYKSAHLDEELGVSDFLEKIKIPVDNSDWSSWEDAWKDEIGQNQIPEDVYYEADQLFRIEIGEDVIFDKHRSDIIFDMQYITLFLPAEVSPRGLHEPIASFKFADCMHVFKQDKRAVAENPLNNGMNLNFADVFYLRLYKSYIVKLGRIDDPYFDQMYQDPKKAFIASKNAENRIVEYFYKLYNPK
jgi:gliding motility associated protien GldN